tara:strand:+ start:142 stop:336 length:195 start_codon:yes stop_codon:yes gene_type:complete
MASLEEELLKKRKSNKKKITSFFKNRKDITGMAAGDKEMKFLSEMSGDVDEEIFKKIKALLPKR